MPRSFLLIATTLLAGCAPTIEIMVISPPQGDVFNEGVPILLDVAATADGLPFEPTPMWSAGDWSQTGNGIYVDSLPLGEATITGVVEHEGGEASVDIAVTVVEAPPEPIHFTGLLEAHLYFESEAYTGPAECPHESLELDLQPNGTLTGLGVCTAPVIGSLQFLVEGLVSGSSVTGTMRLEAYERVVEFSGTNTDGDLEATYDETIEQGDGSMRLFGNWTASPGEAPTDE